MQLEQRFELPTPPAAAWAAFQDIGLLVDCLPGASLTGPAVDGNWPLRFEVKLGPIAAAFAGSGRLQSDDSAMAGRFEGQAADKRTQSRVKGAAAFQLSAGGAGTVVKVTVDYALTGSLAQFGRGGIVRELAGALTAQFADNLAARLAPAEPASASPAPEGAAPGGSALRQAQAVADHRAADHLAEDQPAPATAPRPSAGHGATPPAAGQPGGASRAVAHAPSAPPLSVGSLILRALKSRWQRLLRRWRGLPSP